MESGSAQDEATAGRTARAAALGSDGQSALYDSPLARKMRLLAAELEAEEIDAVANCDLGDGADDDYGEQREGNERLGEETPAPATKEGETHAPVPASTPLVAGTGHADTALQLDTEPGGTTSPRAEADGLQVTEPVGDWYYIDRSGVEQGPHPLAHMRYWVETAAIPVSTPVRPCETGAFLPAASFEAIMLGITVAAGPVHGPADEALDRTSSVTKDRAKHARRPPSKRRIAAVSSPTAQGATSPAPAAADRQRLQTSVGADAVEATASVVALEPEVDAVKATVSVVAVAPTTSQKNKGLCACCAGRPQNERRRA